MQRQTLDQAWGEYSYHRGTAEYRRNFSEADSAILRYTRRQEYAPDDPVYDTSNNLESNSPEIVIDIAPSQKDTVNITAKGEDYDYTSYMRDNIVTMTSDAFWMHSLTSGLSAGLELAFTSNSPSRNPNSEIYEGFVRGSYQISEYLNLFAKAGNSWLKQEIEGTTSITSGEIGIERQTDSDRISLTGSRDFSYDYTTGSTYGIYEITSGIASWSHIFIREFRTEFEGSVIKRKPESQYQVGTLDVLARLALIYDPYQWVTINCSYTYLETRYSDVPENYFDNTDTRRENRYSINVGVRY